MNKLHAWIIVSNLALLLLAACTAPTPDPTSIAQAIAATLTTYPTPTPYPTQSPLPTHTALPSLTPYPTYTSIPTITPRPTYTPWIILVTATATSTPLYTPTESSTPTITPTITPTPNQAQTATAAAFALMTHEKGPGFYLVNVDIAPGLWRSQGVSESCYWETTTAMESIIDNHYGMAGVTAYISPSAFQVEFGEDCVYLGPP